MSDYTHTQVEGMGKDKDSVKPKLDQHEAFAAPSKAGGGPPKPGDIRQHATHQHPLRYTRGVSFRCDLCRETVSDCWRCDNCRFDCCSRCMNRNGTVKAGDREMHPTHRHPLVFARNVFNRRCDLCRASLSVAWQCTSCGYDLCHRCMSNKHASVQGKYQGEDCCEQCCAETCGYCCGVCIAEVLCAAICPKH